MTSSLHNRFIVLLATALLITAGLWSYQTMPLDAIPDLSDVQVIVFTDYPDQAPQVVEDQVTYPLTTAIANIVGLIPIMWTTGADVTQRIAAPVLGGMVLILSLLVFLVIYSFVLQFHERGKQGGVK